MEMEGALGIKSYSFIRAVFVVFQALPGSDFSDRIVPILLLFSQSCKLCQRCYCWV